MADEDALNPDGYVPPAFAVPAAVKSQHAEGFRNAMRVTNVIVYPGTDNDTDYWVGLAIVPIALVAIALLWAIGICCQPCCRCRYRTKAQPRLVGFVAFSVLSAAAVVTWCFCFPVGTNLDNAVGKFQDSLDLVLGLLADSAAVLTSTSLSLGNVDEQLDNVTVACRADFADAVQAALRPVLVDVRASLDDILADIPGAREVVVDMLDLDADDAASGVVIAFGTIMLGLTLFFWATTTVQFLDPSEGRIGKLKVCLARSSCITMFTVGLVFITVAVLIAAIMDGLSTAGSDICANPDQAVQRLLAQAQDAPVLSVALDGAVATCSRLPDNQQLPAVRGKLPAPALLLLCYYQTCKGDNYVGDVMTGLQEVLDEEIPQPPSNSTPECVLAAEVITSFVQQDLLRVASEIVDNFRCGRMNPVYVSLVHTALCQGFVDAAVGTWKFFFAGSLLLLGTIALHRHFHLGKGRRHDFAKSGKGGTAQFKYAADSDGEGDGDGDGDGEGGQTQNGLGDGDGGQGQQQQEGAYGKVVEAEAVDAEAGLGLSPPVAAAVSQDQDGEEQSSFHPSQNVTVI